MMKGKNIILVGFMGSGKTTVGKVLANTLGYNFIDTDHLVVKNEGADIPFIFETRGEGYFRKAESSALNQAIKQQDCVVATGGGIVTTPENKVILRQGFVVYLEASPQQIYQNVKDDQSRPLLKEKDVYGKICTMLKDRQGLYEQVAHFTLKVDEKTPEEICKLILNNIK